MSISFSNTLENECHIQFLDKDIKAGLARIVVETVSTVTNSFTCWVVLKSLISPRVTTEARSLRSQPEFHGHCGILATGFLEGGNRDHTISPSAWGFQEILQASLEYIENKSTWAMQMKYQKGVKTWDN